MHRCFGIETNGALSIDRAHLDLTFAHSRFKARLRERRRTIHYAAISDIETRAVPRTLDHIAASAYLGGHLVFSEQIGVNHAAAQKMPKEFVPVLPDAELEEGEMKRADADGVPVLLVRLDGAVCALAHTCSHLGGPLSEGKLEGDVVQCPWHGSQFDVSSGEVKAGPAEESIETYRVERKGDRIEVYVKA